jgi:hypothetical protein
MLETINISELYSYLKLCEMNLDFIGLKRKLNPNKEINEEFDRLMRLRNKMYDEVNKRLKQIDSSNEINKETT